MKKGMIFTLDAAFALFLTMVMMVTFVYLLDSYAQQNDDMLKLSRLARDVRMISKYTDDPFSTALPGNVKMGSACDNADLVATSTGIKYADIDSGDWSDKSDVQISSNRVCLIE